MLASLNMLAFVVCLQALFFSVDASEAKSTSVLNFLDNHPWIPAALVTNSSRSPCPMLNTFANHGFLSRDGRQITKDDFNDAMIAALNFNLDLASATTNAMVAKLGSPKNSSKSFTLEDFAAHDHTEHDASLTRLDLIQGSTIDVSPGLVKMLMDDAPNNYLDAGSIGKTRARREFESVGIGSPKLSEAFTAFAQLESSFIPLVFGINASTDTNDRRAPKDQVKEWLNEERFPVNQGYKRSAEVITRALQTALIADIKASHDLWLAVVESAAKDLGGV
ncbi:Cloroperoxidase [Rhizodiscina lignyota]|uniref:Cloroperoxidase n=1 Tax=Rhizodiscina lignyota TaxID=1504668 RepID=A0A9P4IK46_9PEZI|nr:Cloroperoxidase [Rhizodiscina lignyota]